MPELLPSLLPGRRAPQLVISLGASHVAGALIGRSAAGLTVARYGREELNPDPEGDTDWAVRAGKALARLARARHWRGEATVLLPGHLTLTKRVKTPAVGGAGRETALLFAAQQNLPEALENLTWDGVVVSDDGADLDLLLGTARKSVVEAVVDALTRAELKAAHIRPPGLPPPGPWLEPASPGVFGNIGARSSVLYFNSAAGWWTRRIGTAGNSVTRLMARGLEADFATAQRLKHDLASDENDPGLAAIRHAARREFAELLAAELRRTALTFGCCDGDDRPPNVWLAGGGSRLPGLGPVLADILDRPVHLVEVVPDVTFATPADAQSKAGLADLLSGMDHRNGARGSERPNELRALAWPDLLPWRMKLALSAAKRRRAALVAGLLFALAPFPVAWGYMQGAERLAEQKERLTRQLGPVRAAAMAQRALTSRLENGRKVLAAWARLEGQAASWPLFLDGLETAAAGGAWLERLLPVPAPAPRNAKAPAGPRQIALAGYLRAAPADDPAAPAEARERMRRLTAAFARLPEVASVGQERFDRGTGPELRFECVLTLKADSFL